MRKSVLVLAVFVLATAAAIGDGWLLSSIEQYSFKEGLSPYVDDDTELWGFIDKTGKIIIPARYESVEGFSGGLARVTLARVTLAGDDDTSLVYFINKTGTVVIDAGKNGYEADNSFSDGLALVWLKDGAFAFIDTSGKVVLRLPYEEVESFSEGLAVFKPKTKTDSDQDSYGYIDAKGKEVIPARFGFALPFSDGLGMVEIRTQGKDESRWVYIDKTGAIVLEAEDDGGQFSEGLALSEGYDESKDESYSFFMDKKGKLVLELKGYDRVESFAGGRALVVKDAYYTGFIDKNGKEAVKPAYDDANSFSEGLASVLVDDKVGFIDINGKMVIQPAFSSIVPGMPSYEGAPDIADYVFSEGLCPFMDRDSGNWGFIDKTGKVIIPATYFAVRGFSGGLAYVGVENEELGIVGKFINKKGEVEIDTTGLSYSVLSSFGSELAMVWLDDGSGAYIDTYGHVALRPQYPYFEPFSDGLAVFRTEGGDKEDPLFGYFDAEGKTVIPAQFVEAESFHEGLARVTLPGEDGEQAYIDKSGAVVLKSSEELLFGEGLAAVERYDSQDEGEGSSFVFVDRNGKDALKVTGYDSVLSFSQGRALVSKKSRKLGFIDKKGVEVIRTDLKDANSFSEGLAAVLVGRKVGFIDLSGKMAISPQFGTPIHRLGKGGDTW